MFVSALALIALTASALQNPPPLAPRSPDTPGEALHLAVRKGNLVEVERLIASGTPVEARDAIGSTPLLDAAWTGETEIAEFLIQHGADVNAHHRESGATPLQYAVLTGHTKITRLLLDAGAQT